MKGWDVWGIYEIKSLFRIIWGNNWEGEEDGLTASSLRWPGDKFILKTPHFDAHSSHK